MEWNQTMFREHPKYFGDVVPDIFSEYDIGVRTSAKYFAFGYGDANSIGYLPTDFQTGISEKAAQGRRAEYGSKVYTTDKIGKCIVGANSDDPPKLNNFAFNPFNDYELASVHDGGILNIWHLPHANHHIHDIDTPKVQITGLSAAATCLAFHPSMSDVIAIGGNNAIFVVNSKEGKIICKLEGLEAAVAGLEFMHDGSLIRAVTKDSKLLSFDPRSNCEAKDTIVGDVKCIPENVYHMSSVSQDGKIVIVTGMTGFREPIIQVWNVDNMDKALFKLDFHHKNCFTLAKYDPITNLFYLSFRTTSDLLVYSCKDDGSLSKETLYHSESDTFMSFDLVPKHGIKKREINKVIKFSKNRTQLVPHIKGGKLIYETLNNKTHPTPVGTCEEYLDSKTDDKQLDLSSIATLVDPDFEEKEQRKVSLYIHITAREPQNLEDRYYNIVPSSTVNVPLGTNIKVNDKFCLFPSQVTGGGALGVISSKDDFVGRQKQAEIRCHKDNITTFDISGGIYKDTLVATGSSDAKVFVFKVPENLFDKTKDSQNPCYVNTDVKIEQMYELQHEGKVSLVSFHPRIPNILVTCDKSMDSFKLRLWDLTNGKEIIDGGWSFTDGAIMDIVFEPGFGLLAAVSSQDKKIRIIDIKHQKILLTFECTESMRDVKLTWIKDHTNKSIYFTRLMTLGFAKGSVRKFSIWDVEDTVSKYYDKPTEDDTDSDDGSVNNDEKSDDMKEEISTLESIMSTSFHVSNSIPVCNYDPDTNLVWISSIGDMKLRVYEISHKLSLISEMNRPYTCKEEILGFGWRYKQDCNSAKTQMAHGYRLAKTQVVPVTFHIPRKRYKEYFQDDLYLPTLDFYKESMTLDTFLEWFNDKDYSGKLPDCVENNKIEFIDLRPKDMPLLSEAPPEQETIHQQRRKSQIEKMEQNKLKQQPQSPEQAMEAFSRMVADAPTANRWDAVNIGTEVDDDEWSD